MTHGAGRGLIVGLGLGDAVGAGVAVGVAAATLGVGDDVAAAGLVVEGVLAAAEPPQAARTSVRRLKTRSRAERIS